MGNNIVTCCSRKPENNTSCTSMNDHLLLSIDRLSLITSSLRKSVFCRVQGYFVWPQWLGNSYCCIRFSNWPSGMQKDHLRLDETSIFYCIRDCIFLNHATEVSVVFTWRLKVHQLTGQLRLSIYLLNWHIKFLVHLHRELLTIHNSTSMV